MFTLTREQLFTSMDDLIKYKAALQSKIIKCTPEMCVYSLIRPFEHSALTTIIQPGTLIFPLFDVLG